VNNFWKCLSHASTVAVEGDVEANYHLKPRSLPMKTLRFFALALVSAGLFSSIILADDTQQPPAKNTQKGIATSGKLSEEEMAKQPPLPKKESVSRLHTLLNETKVTFERRMDTKANVEFFVISEFGYDNFTFDIEESASKRYFWIVFPCGKAPESGMPAEAMAKLLGENGKMSTAYFSYNAKSRHVSLKMPISTAGMDAAALKRELNTLAKYASETRSLWDPLNWNKLVEKE
jgi:hypothetical protein